MSRSSLHRSLQKKLFTIKLAEGFAVQRNSSQLTHRFCIVHNGMEMTDWMPCEEMESVLKVALHASGWSVINDQLA